MNKELVTVFVSITAALVTIWKFRKFQTDLHESPTQGKLPDARVQIDGRFVNVSGLTVPELSALAQALISQTKQDPSAATKIK